MVVRKHVQCSAININILPFFSRDLLALKRNLPMFWLPCECVWVTVEHVLTAPLGRKARPTYINHYRKLWSSILGAQHEWVMIGKVRGGQQNSSPFSLAGVKFLQMTSMILLHLIKKKKSNHFKGHMNVKADVVTLETLTETLLKAASDLQLKGLRREPSKLSSTNSIMTE